jgi:hypothetical protein
MTMIPQNLPQKQPLGGNSFSPEISRLMTAAVINSHFREMLLANPGRALAVGYGGEAFHLVQEEKKHIAAIQANSLADFAKQLTQFQGYVSGACAAGD